MTDQSLSLERPSIVHENLGPHAYGLDRGAGLGLRRNRNNSAATAAEVVESAPIPAPEFIQPEIESDTFIDGVDVATPAETLELVDPHSGFHEWEGELIPDVGHTPAKTGTAGSTASPLFCTKIRVPARSCVDGNASLHLPFSCPSRSYTTSAH